MDICIFFVEYKLDQFKRKRCKPTVETNLHFQLTPFDDYLSPRDNNFRMKMLPKGCTRYLRVNIGIECILLNELAAGPYVIPHEHGKDIVSLSSIFQRHLLE